MGMQCIVMSWQNQILFSFVQKGDFQPAMFVCQQLEYFELSLSLAVGRSSLEV